MRLLPAFVVTGLAAVALATGLPVASATAATAVPVATTSSAVGAAAAAPAVAPAAPAAATATPTPTGTATPDATDAISLTVSPENDGIITSGSDLTVNVTVHNGSDGDLAAGLARVYLNRTAFSTRDDLDDWLGSSSTSTFLGTFLTRVDVPALQAGDTVSLPAITVPSATLSLSSTSWGARALAVTYGVGDTQKAQTRSSVVWYPSNSFEATKLAVAVPITVPQSTSGLIPADALASETSAGGILRRELDAVSGRQVALGIDPMILASIRILGSSAPESAKAWLADLEALPNDSFPLYYGDTDLSGIRQAGATKLPDAVDLDADIAAQVKADPGVYGTSSADATSDPTGKDTATGKATPTGKATATGTPTTTTSPTPTTVPTTADLLAFPYTTGGIAWPEEGTVASADLPVFAAGGDGTTILSSDNLTLTTKTTENAASSIGDEKVLVSDDDLSRQLRASTSASSQDAWKSDVALLSADLATLTHERPSNSRTVMATLGRGWASGGSRLGDTLDALQKMPWQSSTSLNTAIASPSTAATIVEKKVSQARITALTPIVSSDAALTQFVTALQQPQLVSAPIRLRMLALSSLSWRDSTAGLTAEVSKLSTQVDSTLQKVKIVEGSSINILGDRSSLPVYVQNDTASIAVVSLRLVPSNYILSVEKNDLSVTIQPNSQSRVTVPVKSVANGKVMIALSLTSPTGAAISAPAQVAINVQAGWETAITLVFGVAVVLIFGGGIYRNVRRRMRRRDEKRNAASSGGTGPDSGGGTGTGGEDPTA